MINISGLCKTYDAQTKAVDHVDLEVGSGEIFALLGPNGAGKSTTIRILTTLSGFDEGKALVAGHDVDRDPDLVRRSIGYVAQDTGVDFFLTGRENLTLQGHLYRMKKREIEERIEELAHYFELKDSLDKSVSEYSGGMRRKLDIATALIHHPKVLFLDEPTLGLDTQSRQSLWKYIRKINEELGLTILLTTHYLEEADKLANRVAIINQGQIKITDTPDVLKSSLGGDIVSLEFESETTQNESLSWNLKNSDFVKETTWEGNKLHLYVTNGAEAIPKAMEMATKEGSKISNISFARPTLDDVFIKYTGTSLTSDSEDGGEQWWEKWAGKGGGGGKWAKKWQENQEEDSSASGDEQNWPDKQWDQTESEAASEEKTWPKDPSDWQESSDDKASSGEQQWPDQQWNQTETETAEAGSEKGEQQSWPRDPSDWQQDTDNATAQESQPVNEDTASAEQQKSAWPAEGDNQGDWPKDKQWPKKDWSDKQ